ncbi:TMEM175 family protein [Actinomadura welshii]|uniref:TMEM175 family protein n=1 Tax=Actinomadura welshii TaxID=3103817 RepID=UPI0007C554DC|nr:TMEM175 family protein [Actinomadura madurae]
MTSRVISRDPDRLVLFTDAVVAIAVTVLVLPLVDVVTQTAEARRPSSEVITEHDAQVYGFLLSFVVILRLWFDHHRIFERISAYSKPLMGWNAAWLLSVVILPFPTEMVGAYSSDDRFTAVLYLGTILAATVCQTALTVIPYRDPEVASETDPPTIEAVRSGLSATLVVAVAFALAWTVPNFSYYALLLLALDRFLNRIWRLIGV